MMVEEASGLRKNFVPRILPWLLAAGTLAVYWVTLNRWVSLSNLLYVVKTSGWTWQPEVVHPVSFIVTCPFRWLPAREIPFALNLFSAVCAALIVNGFRLAHARNRSEPAPATTTLTNAHPHRY